MFLEDIKTYIDGLNLDIPVYMTSLPQTPINCIVLFEYAGLQPQNGYTRSPGLQLLLRTAPEDYETNYNKLSAAAQALQKVGYEGGDLFSGVKINGNLYLRIYSPQSGMTPLGDDDAGNPIITKNFYVVMEEKE